MDQDLGGWVVGAEEVLGVEILVEEGDSALLTIFGAVSFYALDELIS